MGLRKPQGFRGAGTSPVTEDVMHLARLDELMGGLRRTEDRLRLLESALYYMPDSVVVTDWDQDCRADSMIIQYVNPAFQTLWGYSMEEVCGAAPVTVIFGELSKQSKFEREIGWVGSGHNLYLDNVCYRKNGDSVLTRWAIAPVYGTTPGTVVNMVATLRDLDFVEKAVRLG